MILVSYDGQSAYNFSKFESIRVNDKNIVLYPNTVIGRYESHERAKEVFENMLDDFEKHTTLPFSESVTPYYMPKN